MDNIQLGLSKQQILELLGSPIKESTESGMTVLWYKYNAPTLSDLYFFRDDSLERISLSYYQTPKTFREYLIDGNPVISIRKSGPGSSNSLQETVHIWPDKGLSVTTVGSDRNSSVMREDLFAPITLEQYMASWGKNLEGHEQVTISQASLSQMGVGPEAITGVTAGVIVGIAFAVLVVMLIRRKFTSHPSS